MRELNSDYGYKEAADYYVSTLREIGLIPRFDFTVPEEVFLEMCKAANVDPNHPKIGWKGKGNDWNPVDSDAYYSMWCDYGMTDPATGKWSPHRPVGFINERGEREFRLPDNVVEIAKEGMERYSSRRDVESSRTNEAVLEYVKRSIADHRMDADKAKEILQRYGIDMEGEQQPVFSIGEEDKELRDGLVSLMQDAGIEVSLDDVEGQRVLDEDREHQARLMGSKTNRKKSKIASELQGQEMTEEQQIVYDVYTGNKDNLPLLIKRADGTRRIIIRQGKENKGGTQYSLYKHYDTTRGVFSSEEILKIPEVIEKGAMTPKQRGTAQLTEYKYRDESGTTYTVLTENKHGREEFADFYTNKKGSTAARSTHSEEARGNTDESSGTKIQQNSENPSDNVKKFRTSTGEAYGFVKDGKVYIDPRIATSETPVHEYHHLWAEALEKANPEAWGKLKTEVFGNKDLEAFVRDLYPDITDENELAHEMFAQFGGKRGAERLRAEEERMLSETQDGVFGKARVTAMFNTLRRALSKYWQMARGLFAGDNSQLNDMTLEDFADMAMGDLMHQVKPGSETWFADEVTGTRESTKEVAKVENEEGGGIRFSIREKEPPKKVETCYKLMRLGKDGKPYALYIDSATPMEMGTWYDADSPDLSMLKDLPSGVHLVNQKTKETMSYEDFYKEHPDLFPKGKTKYPSKEAVNWATDNGMRFMFIEDTKKGQRRFGGESRRYWNLGINGSGTVSTYSMRPGWHAATLPSMRQIGKGANKDLRDDNFVWVEGEISADIDYNEEARQNPDNDIPDRVPVDGFYMKATNADAAKS